ncbi:MAG TPA: S8 family serine peptidase [Gemmataceae bacterium]|nr:S8 family serine peptidase [Gemmataceae bacterium]
MRPDRPRTPLRLDPLEGRSVPNAAAPIPQADPGSYDPHSLLIRLKADAPRVLAAVAPGAEFERPFGLVNGLWSVRLAAGLDVPTALVAARANPFVEYAEPNYILHVETTPNDPKYADGTLWDMNKIAMPAAWDVSTGHPDVLVAVIDTGADYNHPDLAANIWTNAAEAAGTAGVDDDGNGFVDDIHGYDIVNHDGDPMDDHSHGTHVAGTIGAVGNNGVGVVGVNWSVRIMPVKTFNASGNGTTADTIAGLNYAVQMGARVSNHSYGDNVFSQAHLDAITAAGQAGHLVVAAAGNGNFFGFPINNDSTPFYPASYQPTVDNVISVAATDNTDHFASFSNYGATSVDLAAPGVNIYSTLPGGGYGLKSGTSMAAPHVTGAAALVWAADPSLTMSQVRDRILANTDPIGALNPNRPTVTNGRLNVARAMPSATGLPRLSVSDVQVTEGDSGTADAVFTITLSASSADPVSVDYTTADGSAVAGGDYTTTSGTLTFTPGETSLTVAVPVVGDTATEPGETFFLNLSGPTNATILDGQGVGTIVDNDRPTISIGDVSATEGNNGNKSFTFTVQLSAPFSQTVTVRFATADGTASVGNKDYTARSGTLTFNPGQTSLTVAVQVRGDRRAEPDETFFVNLSNGTNATIADGQGVGTILNDD